MYKYCIILTIVLGTGHFALSQTTTAPATQPTSAPAVTKVDPQVDAILTRQENASNAIRDLQVNIRHELYQIIPDDRQVKLGLIRYRAANKGNNARFMIFFDTLIHEDLKLNQKEWFCFDGKWLREIHEQTKTAIDREVVAPDENIDPFKLGEGPFPLPFGQKKADILKNFTVTLAKPEKNDPANTDHLVMIPKSDSRYAKRYEKLEFWVDRTLNLPIKIVSYDRHSNIVTVNFRDVKINTGISDKLLWVDIPEGFGYQKEPLEGKPQ